jgi:hypothetical protein
MAKNMTRKGLAITAAISLLSFGLVTPALGAGQADTTKVSLEPTDGDAYSVIAGALNEFSLTSNESVSVAGGDLSFLVTSESLFVKPNNSTGVTDTNLPAVGTDWSRTGGVVTVLTTDTTGLAAGDVIYVTATTVLADSGPDDVAIGYYVLTSVTANTSFSFEDGGAAVPAADASWAGAVAAIQVMSYTKDTDTNEIVIDSGVATNATDETLILTGNDSASATATVTAWVDDNNDGDIDSTEYVSPTRTVKFLDSDEITVKSIEWTAALSQTADVAADVTFNQTINWDQALTNIDGVFTNTGDTFTARAETEDTGVVTFSAGPANALNAGRLTLTIKNDTAETIHTARTTVADNDVDSVAVAFATGNNVKQTVDNGDVTVREETKTVTATVTVLDSAGDAVSGAVVVVEEATANGTSLDADAVVKVNGNLVDVDDNTFDNVSLTTNASGQATITITSTDGLDGDVLDLKVSSESIATDGTTVSSDITITWADADYYFYNLPSVPANGAVAITSRWLGEGKSTTLSFLAYDQWGVAPKAGAFRVKATIAQGDLDDAYKYGVFNASGQASITVTDVEKSGEDVVATLALQGFDEDGDSWADDETVAGAVGADYIDAVAFTYSTGENDKVVDDDAPAAEDIQTAEIEAQAWYLGDTDQALVNGDGVNLTGNVEMDLDGTAYAGGLVTISGPSNLLFGNTDGDADTFAYGFGSLTAVLDGNGDFDFTVWSNVSGEFTVTITADGVTETATVEFNGPVDAATAGLADATLTIVAPAYASPGSTLIAVAVLKDQFGNLVESANDALDIEWDGPGLVSGTLPTETNSKGEARSYILFGANETGTGTLTVTYWGEDGDMTGTNGNGDDAEDDNIVKTYTVTLGAAPVAGTVNVGSFNGKLVVYAKNLDGKRISWKVGGNWGKAVAVGNTLNRFDRLTPRKGVTLSVDIYVNGVKTLTKSVVTR